jgi:membrane-associated protease RseP (regulator of RpoE activity)
VTAVSVYLAGALLQGDGIIRGHDGFEMALALLAILGTHEMGHYIACRIHRVDATLPYFIPALWVPLGGLAAWMPIPLMGTFGAVIRIRERFPNRKALFDIGIAGPLAGFLVCLPVLYLGIREAHIVPIAGTPTEGNLGTPFLFDLMARSVPNGMTVELGPLGLAAWFGLLVTALNMMPVGQLDGGHVVYALLKEKAHIVSRIGWWACLALVFVSPSWILWAVLLRFLGRPHPNTVDDEAPLGAVRIGVAILGLAVFVLCFIPDPFPGAWGIVGELLGALRHRT